MNTSVPPLSARLELGIAHAAAVLAHVVEALAGFFRGCGLHAEGSQQVVQAPAAAFVEPLPRPALAEVAVGAVDRLGDAPQTLLGVERVDDLDGAAAPGRRGNIMSASASVRYDVGHPRATTAPPRVLASSPGGEDCLHEPIK